MVESYTEKKKAEHQKEVWLMWHSVALQRSKKLPKLRDMLSDKPQGIDENEIEVKFKNLAKKKEVKNG